MGAEMRAALLGVLARCPYPVRQNLLGTAYLLVPRRLPGLLPLMQTALRDIFTSNYRFPDPSNACENPDGLCGVARDLTVASLIAGYTRGMFLMSHIGPAKWWAPRHRMVLFFDNARVEKTTRRLLRNNRFRTTFDAAFATVVRECARPRSGGTPLTWITPPIEHLFLEAHALGYAHSFEVWDSEDLVGGGFGVAIGRTFYTESQFHSVRDASKVGFAVLNRHLQAWGYAFNDGKHATRYLAAAGMVPLAREEFSGLAGRHALHLGRIGRWAVEEHLLDDKWQPAEAPGLRMADLLPGGTNCRFSAEDLMSTARSPTW